MSKKTRVGILTYTMANNFGAVLQAFALGETIKALGYDVTFLRYKPQSTKNIAPQSLSIKIKKLILRLLTLVFFGRPSKSFPKLVTRFEDFRRTHMTITSKECTNISEAENDEEFVSFDIYVVGSDWVWKSPYDKVFFLDFLKNKSALRIAYAASANVSYISSKYVDDFKKLLENFDIISTREETLTKNVNLLSLKMSQTMPDPTLLFGQEFWSKYAGNKPIIEGDYILVYAMRPNLSFSSAARKCKRQLKMKSVGIVTGTAAINLLGTRCDKIMLDIGPAEFLNLVKYAKFVFTSSFHGTVFASLFHVSFIAYPFSSADKRMSDMLRDVGLEERYVTKNSQIDDIDFKHANFAKTDSVLKAYRIKTDKFLTDALENKRYS